MVWANEEAILVYATWSLPLAAIFSPRLFRLFSPGFIADSEADDRAQAEVVCYRCGLRPRTGRATMGPPANIEGILS